MPARATIIHYGDERFRGRLISRDPVVDVRDFGAVGDNTTDDTQAIQRALDFAGSAGRAVVYFPQGVYRITGPLSFTASWQDLLAGEYQFVLLGDDPGVSVISVDPNAVFPNPGAIFNYVGPQGLNLIVKDLRIGDMSLAIPAPTQTLHVFRGPIWYVTLDNSPIQFNHSAGNNSALVAISGTAFAPDVYMISRTANSDMMWVFVSRIIDGSGATMSGGFIQVIGNVSIDTVANDMWVNFGVGLRRLFYSSGAMIGPVGINLPGAQDRAILESTWVVGGSTISVGDGIASLDSCRIDATVTTSITGNGRIIYNGSAWAQVVWDPPVIPTGGYADTIVTVPGAKVGDAVAVGHTQVTGSGLLLSGVVSAANTVRVTLWNFSGISVDIPSGTLTVRVMPQDPRL